MTAGDIALFTGAGPRLTHWVLAADHDTLHALSHLDLPANVQYAWPHPAADILYVASSDGGMRHGPRGMAHHLTACAVDRASGALSVLGERLALPQRPIHLSVDPSGTHVLVAFNTPSAVRIYSLLPDGRLGTEVPQREGIDAGDYAHQVRVTADGRSLLSVALGQDPEPHDPEHPGSINVFAYADGKLGAQQVVAPDGGRAFGPRHVDFHPNGRWVYATLERQNRLEMFELAGGRLSEAPRFSRNLLSAPRFAGGRQGGGAVHVHPNGRFVYVSNRAWTAMDVEGTPVLAGGENTIAVYAIDPATGEPTLLQHVDTQGIHCRTFAIDATGTTLVAAHVMGLHVRKGDGLEERPAGLSVFRIAEDGSLQFDRFHALDTHGAFLFWMGIPGFAERG